MILAHFLTDVNEANMFVVACESKREALLIDAATFDPRLTPFLDEHGLRLTGVFITHDHYDHTNGLAEIRQAFHPHIYAGSDTVAGLPAQVLHHGDTIQIGDLEARAVALPGHTATGMGLILPGVIFTGDALFAGSIGGTDNLHNKAVEIDHIRRHVFTLPETYQVHTGHGPSTTVHIEKTANPFFV